MSFSGVYLKKKTKGLMWGYWKTKTSAPTRGHPNQKGAFPKGTTRPGERMRSRSQVGTSRRRSGDAGDAGTSPPPPLPRWDQSWKQKKKKKLGRGQSTSIIERRGSGPDDAPECGGGGGGVWNDAFVFRRPKKHQRVWLKGDVDAQKQ